MGIVDAGPATAGGERQRRLRRFRVRAGTNRVGGSALPIQTRDRVELSEEFTRAASQTIERNARRLRCTDVELVHSDVLDFEIPEDISVAYFHNPFSGDILDTVLERLIESVDQAPRRLRVVYVAATLENRAALAKTGRLRFVRYGRRVVRRWARADYLALYEISPGRPRREPAPQARPAEH